MNQKSELERLFDLLALACTTKQGKGYAMRFRLPSTLLMRR